MRRVKGLFERVKEQRKLLHTVEGRKANWIGHMVSANFHLKKLYSRRDRKSDKTKKTYAATTWPERKREDPGI
jgi:hypothetical protein